MSKIKVIICDDHPIFREGLLRIIESDDSLKIVGECGDGDSALDYIRKAKPDIAILDITMPGKSGLTVARLVKQEQLPTKTIILTMHKDEEYLNEAIEIGVHGYLVKENAVTDLVICIHKVVSGQYFVSPLLEEILMKHTQNVINESAYLVDLDKLEKVERKILKLTAQNKTSGQIAEDLNISLQDMQKHRKNIVEKLDLHGPYKLYQFALKYKDRF